MEMNKVLELANNALRNPHDYNSRQEFLKNIEWEGEDWQFLEIYMNNYTQDNLILMIDLADRFIDHELTDIKDMELIRGYGNLEQIKEQRDKWIGECFKEAIENWVRTIPSDYHCPKCGGKLFHEPFTATEDHYPYFCPECDENFFEFEVE